MSSDDLFRRTSPLPPLEKPVHDDVDSAWEDELFEDDAALDRPSMEIFDRETAIPDEPLDELARESMSITEADNSIPEAQEPVAELAEEDVVTAAGVAEEPTTPGLDWLEEPPTGKAVPKAPPPPLGIESEAHPAPAIESLPVTGEDEPGGYRQNYFSPGSDAPRRSPTPPEPVVTRHQERTEAGSVPPAERLEQRRSGRSDLALQLNIPADAPSALDFVDRFSHAPADEPAANGPNSVRAPEPSGTGTLQDLEDRYAVGDFTGALVIAESILETTPDNVEAKRYAQSCREVLTQMYAARIGPLDQIVSVAVTPEEIRWLSLDHRAGFLLSLVDGISTVEEILDVSGMTRLEALRIMFTLTQQNVVTLS